MTDPTSARSRLDRLVAAVDPADPELASALRIAAASPGAELGVRPEDWFDHVLRLPEAARELAITTLPDQTEAEFLPVTLAIAADAPLPYHRVFALKRLSRSPGPKTKALFERLHAEGKGPDYGPYFAIVMDQIDPVWARGVLASPAATPPPGTRPKKVNPDEEEWGPDSMGVWPTILIGITAAIGIAVSVAWALRLLPRWVP